MAKARNAGTKTEEKPSVKALQDEITEARAAYIKLGGHWQKDEDEATAKAGKRLIAARDALKAAAGTGTVREAYAKLGFKPTYAPRARKVEEKPKAVAKAA